jgi:hypothetical protein
MDDLYEHPPVWVAEGEDSHFTDVDGHTYLDMYVADMSAFCGHGPAPVTDAIAHRMSEGQPVPAPRPERGGFSHTSAPPGRPLPPPSAPAIQVSGRISISISACAQ